MNEEPAPPKPPSRLIVIHSAKDDDLDINIVGYDTKDAATLTLLRVVESLTGVTTDSYQHLVAECRRVAAREQANL